MNSSLRRALTVIFVALAAAAALAWVLVPAPPSSKVDVTGVTVYKGGQFAFVVFKVAAGEGASLVSACKSGLDWWVRGSQDWDLSGSGSIVSNTGRLTVEQSPKPEAVTDDMSCLPEWCLSGFCHPDEAFPEGYTEAGWHVDDPALVAYFTTDGLTVFDAFDGQPVPVTVVPAGAGGLIVPTN